jgi:hypothetical protein
MGAERAAVTVSNSNVILRHKACRSAKPEGSHVQDRSLLGPPRVRLWDRTRSHWSWRHQETTGGVKQHEAPATLPRLHASRSSTPDP